MKFTSFLFSAVLLCSFQALSLTAQYQVPVTSLDLAPFAQFDLKSLNIVAGQPTKIRYHLPRMLDGSSEWMEFKGSLPTTAQPSTVLSGDQGSMACELQAADVRCKVSYYDLATNEQFADHSVELISKTFEESVARKKVGRLFRCDPVGFITIGNGLRPHLPPILRPLNPQLVGCGL